jgi:hypothetical protein
VSDGMSEPMSEPMSDGMKGNEMETNTDALRKLAELCEKPYEKWDAYMQAMVPTLWNPFASTSDAFEVIEAMRKRGFWIRVNVFALNNSAVIVADPVRGDFHEFFSNVAEIPAAICNAALAALAANRAAGAKGGGE